ncbi:MAG: GNAT family N-acetyltransferase [Algoriphagus sp.]|nr:GNAT family N-acetyltransferase [Algoriphagus sp.]
MVTYQLETDLPLQEYIDILNSSGLGKRRPMGDSDHLGRMLTGSNLILTAREDGEFIGILRALSDFCYRTFIADLAVVKERQGEGIGKALVQMARETSPEARLFLFSAEDSEGFYQKLGFQLHEHCYQLKVGEPLR